MDDPDQENEESFSLKLEDSWTDILIKLYYVQELQNYFWDLALKFEEEYKDHNLPLQYWDATLKFQESWNQELLNFSAVVKW